VWYKLEYSLARLEGLNEPGDRMYVPSCIFTTCTCDGGGSAWFAVCDTNLSATRLDLKALPCVHSPIFTLRVERQ
jgi:hypothetical protein